MDIIRYGDLDSQGHVNNAVYSTYFESGRVMLMRDPAIGIRPAGMSSVVARMEIDYLKELRWPGSIEIGTGVTAIGTKSYTLAQAIFHQGTCVAAGRATVVLISEETRRANVLPEAVVERLRGLWVGK